jgi:23S rRNA (guanosine2251-2'-O)-methyltransferase
MPKQSIITGRRPVLEALKAGTAIERIVTLSGIHGRIIEELKTLAEARGVKVIQVEREQFRTLADEQAAQGVCALIAAWHFAEIPRILDVAHQRAQPGLLLILDGIEDPHNFGALVRTAECAGLHGLIVPKHHAASVTTAVVKASAGATEHILIAEVTNLVHTIGKLKEDGYWIVGLDAAGDKFYTEVDFTLPVAIVVGNEGKGIRRLVRDHCDFLARIPLFGKIDSLNASVAGALVMYEAVRQRTQSARSDPGPRLR